jgi:hypothetical protein
MRHARRLYRYFTEEKWADAFLDGSLRFRSLAYYRDFEDAEVRGDQNEGIAIMRPVAGLEVTNQTQHTKFIMPDSAFESVANAGEIFVYCLSKSDTEDQREKFRAVACVEIFNTKAFCRRVQAALPRRATFPGRPGHQKIGQHVEYYKVTAGVTPRWALPDLIAASKLHSYGWQDEFRLVFSLTDALAFEKVSVRVVQGPSRRIANPADHHFYDLQLATSLRDIAVFHKLPILLTA